MNQLGNTLIFKGLTQASNAVARIGVILISSDEVGGDAFSSIMPKDALVFMTRSRGIDLPDGGFALDRSFAEIADTLPRAGRFDVLAFNCTSGSVAIGIESLLSQLEKARPGLRYTSPAIAAIRALKQLKANKIALLTPYEVHTHKLFLPFFHENGFEIAVDGTFDLHTDAEICELSRKSIFDAAKKLVEGSSPEALFVSCTATPIVSHIGRLEEELGIPVVTSSQAMAWDALRLAEYRKPIEGFGQLLAAPR